MNEILMNGNETPKELFLEEEIQKEGQELVKYNHPQQIIDKVMNKNNGYWVVKHVHASWHGWQHINHWNSKAQLHFDVNKFYNDFNIKDKTWEDFEKVFGKKNITADKSFVILENQETRYASKNEENVLNHLRQRLFELFREEKHRVETEISQEQNELRLEQKKRNSQKKKNRGKVILSDEN